MSQTAQTDHGYATSAIRIRTHCVFVRKGLKSRPLGLGEVVMRVYVRKSFKLVARALALSSCGSTTARHATAARATTPPGARGVVRGRIARPVLGVAAAGAVIATCGLAAAGTAGAATGSVRVVYGHPLAGYRAASGSTAAGTAGAAAGSMRVFYNNHGAGYDTAYFDNWRFRYVATTVPVAACRIAPSKNPDAETQLWGGTKWFAAIAVFCNGGAGGVGFYDQESATTQASDAFRLSPRVGDRLRISISRNVAGHQDSFTVTNLRTGRSQTVRVTTSTAVVYHHAFVGSEIDRNADVMPLPATSKLLWNFRNSRVITYGGVRGTFLGPWATVKEIDRTSAGVTVMYPGNLSSGGANLSTYLHPAS